MLASGLRESSPNTQPIEVKFFQNGEWRGFAETNDFQLSIIPDVRQVI